MTKQEYLEYNKACEAEIRKMTRELNKIKLPNDPVSRHGLAIAQAHTANSGTLRYIITTREDVSFLTDAEFAAAEKSLCKSLADMMEKLRAKHAYIIQHFARYIPQ